LIEIIMKPLFFGILLASALGLAQGAGALTLDTRTPANPDGSAKFVDPDQQVENLTSAATRGSAPGTKTFHSGNSTFSFGVTGGDGRPTFGRASPFNNLGVNRGLRGFDREQ
jgi:hypothetical protein